MFPTRTNSEADHKRSDVSRELIDIRHIAAMSKLKLVGPNIERIRTAMRRLLELNEDIVALSAEVKEKLSQIDNGSLIDLLKCEKWWPEG